MALFRSDHVVIARCVFFKRVLTKIVDDLSWFGCEPNRFMSVPPELLVSDF
jgi:hypothetical protein